jgi:type II secretory pathway pseudopilin PulG
MTLLEIMIVLAILALVMGLVVGPRVMKMFASSKVDIAKAEMRKLAHEAFPLWSSANPSKSCPDKIEDVAEFADKKEMKDPWGQPYKFFCGPTLPPGAKGLAIQSSGEDAKENTSDDLKSWGE